MNRLRRFAWAVFRFSLISILVIAAVVGAGWWYLHPKLEQTRGIVYTQRNGHNLTFDVVRPAKPSGVGILIMVSGGWKSDPEVFKPWQVAAFLRQGQTVFAVSHLSQPAASVMETVADIRRAARFIRHHAADYGINPHRLGVAGGSSGGHLSLMLATCGGPGDPAALDAVEREDGSVQAAAVFFPVTDLIDLGPSSENGGEGPPIHFRASFGPDGTDPQTWQRIGHDFSPIFHITSALPPVFIIHGDSDPLVPLDQSLRFQKAAADLGHKVELLVRPGKAHGWYSMLWDSYLFARWFDRQLPTPKS